MFTENENSIAEPSEDEQPLYYEGQILPKEVEVDGRIYVLQPLPTNTQSRRPSPPPRPADMHLWILSEDSDNGNV